MSNFQPLKSQSCHNLVFSQVWSENGPNEFLMPKNQWIDTKFKNYLGCSEPKLHIGLFFFNILTETDIWPLRSTDLPENGSNERLMATNLEIGTQIKSSAYSEP